MDKAWANETLRFGIRVLKGDVIKCRDDNALLETVLLIKESLETFGYWWQAKRLDNHIHRWQRDRAALARESLQPKADSPRERGESHSSQVSCPMRKVRPQKLEDFV